MKKCIVCALAAAFVLTGCNTVKGFGKDVSKAGVQISNTAQKVAEQN